MQALAGAAVTKPQLRLSSGPQLVLLVPLVVEPA